MVKGFIFTCDKNGIINQVITNYYNGEMKIKEREDIKNYIDKNSLEKFILFCEKINLNKGAIGWEINMNINQKIYNLNFSGLLYEEYYYIIIEEKAGDILDYYEELLKLNNEHVNRIRSIMKDFKKFKQKLSYQDQINEVSKLNNELVNTKRELIKKNLEYQKLDKQKNEYLGMAAHDLRNPLGSISGFSYILKLELEEVLNQEQKEMLDIISSSSEFMLKLIDDLLDISKIQVGKLNLDIKEENIQDLLEENITLNKVIASKKNINIEFIIDDYEIPKMYLDKNKMHQVFNNLIGNAIKFSYENSSIKVVLNSYENFVLIKIIDEGTGISKEDIESIFNPYTQSNNKSTKGEKGSGLGLAIARKIIEGHNGSIDVSSIMGKGSTFIIKVPIEK